MNFTDYFTSQQVADKFGISIYTLRAWVKTGKIKPSFVIGRTNMYSQSDLDNRIVPQNVGRPRKEAASE